MACYRPLRAWRGKVQSSGKRSIVFKRGEAAPSLSCFDLKLPCGQCVGCRLERSRQWAMRCVHESSLYSENCFVTLTYNDGNMPSDGSLCLRDFQLFMKRLRKYAARTGIRFFHCGEYGDLLGRPHYHACVFNYSFRDRVPWKRSGSGEMMYRSDSLEKLWPVGFSTVSDVSFESAAYVARYVMKKVTGKDSVDHYVKLNEVTGELTALKPEYITMSRRPGIGRGWYDKFKLDMYPHDYGIMRGVKMRPPKFYDGLYELENPDGFRDIKCRRVSRADVFIESDVDGRTVMVSDNDSFRLPVKEEVKLAQVKLLSRSMESE